MQSNEHFCAEWHLVRINCVLINMYTILNGNLRSKEKRRAQKRVECETESKNYDNRP